MLPPKTTRTDWLHNWDKKQWTWELEKGNIKSSKISYLPWNKVLTALRMIKEEWRKITKAELNLTSIWSHLFDKRLMIKKVSLLIEKSKTLTSIPNWIVRRKFSTLDMSKFQGWRAIWFNIKIWMLNWFHRRNILKKSYTISEIETDKMLRRSTNSTIKMNWKARKALTLLHRQELLNLKFQNNLPELMI